MIAFYMRLSLSDGDLGVGNKDESNSIEHQRMILRNYVKDKGIEGDVAEYVDDGYTGTNFDRPQFQKMISDCQRQKVNTVIVKDISRLGRDYIGVGDYTERIFPMLGIRFISVTNNYDSDRYAGQAASFDLEINSLVSAMYSRDISKKRKSTIQTKWRQGISTNSDAPYGYMKDPDKKGKMAIDPEAARTVRFVFKKAAEGMLVTDIARLLNDKGVITPEEYRKTHRDCKYQSTTAVRAKEQAWDYQKVRILLKRLEYTGTLVAGKRSPIKIGSKAQRLNDRSEWVTVEAAWEPIISKELFEKANLIFREKKDSRVNPPRKYALKGIGRCGTCGLILDYETQAHSTNYRCGHGIKLGKHSNCCKKRYPSELLEGTVFRAVKLLLNRLCDVSQYVENKIEEDKVEALDKRQSDILRQTKTLKADKISLYESYAEGHISREQYISKKNQVVKLLEDLEKEVNSIEKERDKIETELFDLKDLEEKVDEFIMDTKPTQEMFSTFIEAVYVYNENKIEIKFKFEDRIRKILEKVQ